MSFNSKVECITGAQGLKLRKEIRNQSYLLHLSKCVYYCASSVLFPEIILFLSTTSLYSMYLGWNIILFYLSAQVENKYSLLNFSLCKHKFIVSRKIPYCAILHIVFRFFIVFIYSVTVGYFLFSHSGFSAFSQFSTMITYYFYNQQKTNLRIVHINIPLLLGTQDNNMHFMNCM